MKIMMKKLSNYCIIFLDYNCNNQAIPNTTTKRTHSAKSLFFTVFLAISEYCPLMLLSINKLVNSFKGMSSRLLRQEFQILRSNLWFASYFTGNCGCASLICFKRVYPKTKMSSLIFSFIFYINIGVLQKIFLIKIELM